MNNQDFVHITKIQKSLRAWKIFWIIDLYLKKCSSNQINFWYNYWMDNSPLIYHIQPNTDHVIIEEAKINDFITI